MEKQAWKEFYLWMETASEEELIEKRVKIEDLLPKLARNTEITRDARRMIRDIDQELVNRCI